MGRSMDVLFLLALLQAFQYRKCPCSANRCVHQFVLLRSWHVKLAFSFLHDLFVDVSDDGVSFVLNLPKRLAFTYPLPLLDGLNHLQKLAFDF
jgi:hypothetical protein